MKQPVTGAGLVLPKQWFNGADEVEVRREPGLIVVVVPGHESDIRQLGTQPVVVDEDDASVHHDLYVSGT